MVPPGQIGRWNGPTGAVDLVAYEGGVSHDIAFGDVLGDTAAMVRRMSSAAPSGLVVAATDAETFGHHHQFTERGVAHALFHVTEEAGVRTGGLAALLPGLTRSVVQTVPPSAWSCAHGIGRWERDCGCSTDGRPGWDQSWRRPLRDALTVLRDHAFEVLLRRGAEVFHDPVAARDDFGPVLAEPAAWPDFVQRHVRLLADERVARVLLASQEATLASFTSCAWFFADLARREVVIVMQEAQRSIELLTSLGEQPPLTEVLAILETARSNNPSVKTGADVWALAADGDGLLPHDGAPGTGPFAGESRLTPVLLGLVDAAVEGSAEAAAQAVELIDVTARAGSLLPLEHAQERIWARIEAGTLAPDATALAGVLGFAGYQA